METAAAGELYRPPRLKRSEALPAAAVGQELAACSAEVQAHSAGNISQQSPCSPSERVWGHVSCDRQVCQRALIPAAVPGEALGATPVAPLPLAVSNGGEEGWAVSAGGAQVATRAP